MGNPVQLSLDFGKAHWVGTPVPISDAIHKNALDGDFAVFEGTVFVSCRKGSIHDLRIARRIIDKLIAEVDNDG